MSRLDYIFSYLGLLFLLSPPKRHVNTVLLNIHLSLRSIHQLPQCPSRLSIKFSVSIQWSAGYLGLFAFGNGSHNSWDGSWQLGWDSLGAPGGSFTLSLSAAAVWGSNRLDVIGMGMAPDYNMYHQWRGGSYWSENWENVGNRSLASYPTVASRGANRLGVFARGNDLRTYHNAWDGLSWTLDDRGPLSSSRFFHSVFFGSLYRPCPSNLLSM